LARYPSRRKLITKHFEGQACSETSAHNENEELKAALEKVQEQLQSQAAEREAEKEQHRRQMEEMQNRREADKEELRKEFMAMLTAQSQGATTQVTIFLTSLPLFRFCHGHLPSCFLDKILWLLSISSRIPY